IQNKIGQFTGNPLIRNIIGQPKSSFDIRTMMDEKKILIINLSKGLVGETNMRLLGSMLTTRIFLGAMSRADLPASKLAQLPNFYFYVDEFQNFANETFAEILSEARKYKLNLIIAHQYIEQMEEEVRDAVFGNVGTTVVFRVGPFDAEVLETIFMPRFTKEDIASLDKRQVYMTLMIDGVGSTPFSAVTIPPIEPPATSNREAIIEASRAQFTAQRAGIEGAIMEELAASIAAPVPLDARMKRRPTSGEWPKKASATASPTPVRREAPARTSEKTASPSEEALRRPQEVPRAEIQRQPAVPSSTPKVPAAHPVVTRSTPTTKSPDDLKSILRSITTKTAVEREEKQTNNQQSLKGALADVLTRNQSASMPDKQRERPKTAVAETSYPLPHRVPTGIPATQSGFPAQEKGPFEVPEDALRKILKGET
ncbi:MAG: TraM recognition domain-containing protein, partial [Patescibacteria group bacterium]